jgi:hypothetical protein
MDIAEITGLTLETAVPGFADAAVIYTAEGLLRGGALSAPGAIRRDASGRIAVRRAGTRFTWGGPDAGAFPPGQAVVFASGSPYARCVAGSKPVAFTQPGEQALEETGPGATEIMTRYASFLAVPLTAPLEGADAVVGLVTLAREPVRPAFGTADIDAVTRLASCAGTGIANVLALERYRGIADVLQQGLLAAEPVPPENLEVAGRIQAADGYVVGGDWYDLIPLPGGRTGIVLGDVMGHGAEAAAVMAQLRAAAHVLAELDLQPAELLGHLNQFILTLLPDPLATCLYAVIDPARQTCTLAAAGHLPPVLASRGKAARVLDLPSGHFLGISPPDFGQSRIRLRPGTVIAFYTDGLVETRTRSFDQGISALCSELDRVNGELAVTRDALIRSLADRAEDDVTLILARIPDCR